MLRQTSTDREEDGLVRQWYLGNAIDLILWRTENGELAEFQITYRRDALERALTWRRDTGFAHDRVDAGEDRSGRYKMAPLLGADHSLDRPLLLSLLAEEGADLDPALIDEIARKVREYPLEVGEYVQARWDGGIDDALWLGSDPAVPLVSIAAAAEHLAVNSDLPDQVVELLGAWSVLLCLRESRWAPAGSIVASTTASLRAAARSFSPERARALESGIDAVGDRLRPIAGEPAAVIVEAATARFREMLHDRLRE